MIVSPKARKSPSRSKKIMKFVFVCFVFSMVGGIFVLLKATRHHLPSSYEVPLLMTPETPKSMDRIRSVTTNIFGGSSHQAAVDGTVIVQEDDKVEERLTLQQKQMKRQEERLKQAAAELAAEKEQLAKERLEFEQQKMDLDLKDRIIGFNKKPSQNIAAAAAAGAKNANIRPNVVKDESEEEENPEEEENDEPQKQRQPQKSQIDNNRQQNMDPPQKSVVCGGHKAASCDRCPQGHGEAWCHGDCSWCADTKKCISKGSFCPTCTTKAAHNEAMCKALPVSEHCHWCDIATQCLHVDSFCPTERIWKAPHKEKWFTPPDPIDKYNRTLSVVLPCGSENDFFERTIRSIYAATPPEILKDIIVVDDNSVPPLEPMFSLDKNEYKVNFIRSNVSLGLIDAKHQGAMAATGDIIVFFDCHVKPAIGYWEPFVREIAENPKRVVVPSITHLDVDLWKESGRPPDNLGGNSKCYTTMDSDFKWVANNKPWVPTMSGGLLAIGRDWFFEIGGHDQNMKGWGGENIDLSFRIWRCGGEIIAATQSYVAHMWRTTKPATKAKYTLPKNAVYYNRARAMKAHAPEMFGNKTLTYPAFERWRATGGSDLDVRSIVEPMAHLHCKDFNWYLDFFSYIYRDAGIIPKEVFQLTPDDGATCLMLRNRTTWAPNTNTEDELILGNCTTTPGFEATSGTQYWHLGNKKNDGTCCSGLQAWNTNQCMVGNLRTSVCASMRGGQKALLRNDGSLKIGPQCLNINPLSLAKCDNKTTQKWKKLRPFQPPEFIAMSKELQDKW